MKYLLSILCLFIFSCDSGGDDSDDVDVGDVGNICAKTRNEGFDDVSCYINITQLECNELTGSGNNQWSTYSTEWYENYTCENFCEEYVEIHWANNPEWDGDDPTDWSCLIIED